ncbi:MAG TPA: hypothetical protein VEJ18_09880 [Planctomycetota bacterium]|nr:hypothetical protein [Planctomycetota bacterium]
MVSDTPAGRSLFNRNREKVADAVGGFADALRETGRRLENDERSRAAGPYAERAATYAERAADYLRRHDLESVLHEGEQLALRHPAAFLGGCFAAGLLAGRLLRSGIQARHDEAGTSPLEEVADFPTSETPPPGPGPAVADIPGAAEAEAGRPVAEGGASPAEKGGL